MQPVSATPVSSVRVVPGTRPLGARIVTVQSPAKGAPQSPVSGVKQVFFVGTNNTASPITVPSVNGARPVVMVRPSGSFQAVAPRVGGFQAPAPARAGSIKATSPVAAEGVSAPTPAVCLAQPVRVPTVAGVSPVKVVGGSPLKMVVQARPQPLAAPQQAAKPSPPAVVSPKPAPESALQQAAESAQKGVQLPTKAVASAQPACCFNFMGKLKDKSSPKSSRQLSVGGFAKVKAAGPYYGTTAKITKTNGHAFKVGGKWYLAEELQPTRG